MAKRLTYYNKIISLLRELHKDYPNESLGQHLAGALSEYQDLWGIPDKEILFALEKYQVEKNNNASDSEIEKIYKDGLNLDKILLDEDDDDDY